MELFKKYDADGSGYMEIDEFAELVEDLRRRGHELATKGIIGTVAGVATAPLSLAGSAIGQAKVDGTDSSLGELWIQFLSDEGSPAEG